jgi:hypothetical protein
MSDDIDDTNLELYPSWRQALVRFREGGFSFGDILPHAWLYEQFECEALDDPKITWEQAQKFQLRLLSQFQPFREALLDQDQIDLQSVPGVGYELVPPADQSRRAVKDTMKDIQKAMRKGVARATNVNTAMLTAEQRRDHADNLARLGMLRQMLKPPRELPPPDE